MLYSKLNCGVQWGSAYAIANAVKTAPHRETNKEGGVSGFGGVTRFEIQKGLRKD